MMRSSVVTFLFTRLQHLRWQHIVLGVFFKLYVQTHLFAFLK